ncbi:hypothetical protein V1264_008769 [Littorina saxatilis]|uniref:Uncharacterized protein n=1 Tax=Littorina saxatilis TaxID=31220 RepID=A0AAN9G2P2_9CAEN
MKRKPMTEPERKRRRRHTTAERNKRTMDTGGCKSVSVTVGAESAGADEALAEILLDFYYAKTQEQQSFTSIKATGGRQPVMQESDVS